MIQIMKIVAVLFALCPSQVTAAQMNAKRKELEQAFAQFKMTDYDSENDSNQEDSDLDFQKPDLPESIFTNKKQMHDQEQIDSEEDSYELNLPPSILKHETQMNDRKRELEEGFQQFQIENVSSEDEILQIQEEIDLADALEASQKDAHDPRLKPKYDIPLDVILDYTKATKYGHKNVQTTFPGALKITQAVGDGSCGVHAIFGEFHPTKHALYADNYRAKRSNVHSRILNYVRSTLYKPDSELYKPGYCTKYEVALFKSFCQRYKTDEQQSDEEFLMEIATRLVIFRENNEGSDHWLDANDLVLMGALDGFNVHIIKADIQTPDETKYYAVGVPASFKEQKSNYEYSSKAADLLNGGSVITTPSLQDIVEAYPGPQKPDRYVYLDASNEYGGSHFDQANIDFDKIQVEEDCSFGLPYDNVTSLGDCGLVYDTKELPSGHSCDVECDADHHQTRAMSCKAGVLTTPLCIPTIVEVEQKIDTQRTRAETVMSFSELPYAEFESLRTVKRHPLVSNSETSSQSTVKRSAQQATEESLTFNLSQEESSTFNLSPDSPGSFHVSEVSLEKTVPRKSKSLVDDFVKKMDQITEKHHNRMENGLSNDQITEKHHNRMENGLSNVYKHLDYQLNDFMPPQGHIPQPSRSQQVSAFAAELKFKLHQARFKPAKELKPIAVKKE